MKKENDPDQKDMLETAARLLAGGGLTIVCALYRKPMTKKQLCRLEKDCPKEQLEEALVRLEACGIICQEKEEKGKGCAQENSCWRLTELGEELEETFAGLERFGRLYERLQSLGLGAQEEMAVYRTGQTAPFKKGGQIKAEKLLEENGQSAAKKPCEEKEPDGEKKRRDECARRHGWAESGGQFLFYNPHQGYEDWYFYGKRSGETAAVYLITGEEYAKMREWMAAGKNAADAGSRLYLKIEMKAADVAPGQEAFYVRAEDLLIQESVREF